jgi:drug/metabolite transporter (DMT)-like permease
MFSALKYTEAGTGAVINGAIPVLVICADYLLFRYTVSRSALLGIALSFVGTVIVVTHGDLFGTFSEGVGRGEGLFLIAILGWTGYTIFGRGLLSTFPAVTITAYSCLAGAILMIPIVLADLPAAYRLLNNSQNITILVVQGALTMGVGFLWYYEGVQKLGTATASVYLNLVPVMGVVLAMVTLGEIPGIDLLVGGSLVVVGLIFASRSK